MVRGLGDSSVPIAAGTHTLNVSVSVSFKVGPKLKGAVEEKLPPAHLPGERLPPGPKFGPGGEGNKPRPDPNPFKGPGIKPTPIKPTSIPFRL